LADKVELPRNADLARQVLDAQVKERGMLGAIFGTKEHAPTNIAALGLVLLIGMLAVIVLWPTLPAGIDRGGFATALLGAVTFTLGLIFGRGSSGS
jgi:hypothetical protein